MAAMLSLPQCVNTLALGDVQCSVCSTQFTDWHLEHFLWSWWLVSIGSGNSLVSSGNKLLPEPMLTQTCLTIYGWYDLINVTQQHGGFILRLIKATLPEVTHNCLKAHRDGYYQHISLLKLNFPLQIKVSSHLPSKSTLQYTWEKFT